MNADVEWLAAEFCRENGIAVTMSREMPAGYENAYGTYDVTVNTLFLNPAMLWDAPEHEVLYYLYHELRHAVQYICPGRFGAELRELYALWTPKERMAYPELEMLFRRIDAALDGPGG